ncbi:MECDP-synthase [Saccharophagus degradans]|uniref:MECDP-synthase n=1 Tax=Saccharophagus degradans TaxID=86304 RepID=UPI002477F159|nr:MECDP-synthase [Saccharophagus degradans]WGO97329.1 MECDP-synthase [Saccharophagus degradans]
MKKKFALLPLAAILASSLIGCSGDDNKNSASNEPLPIERTYVLFSPATRELPVPSDLQFSSETAGDGTMSAGTDPSNPVITGIDALDGNSVLAPIDIMFTDSLDPNQVFDGRSFIAQGEQVIPNPLQNVFLLPLTYPSGDALSQAAIDINGDDIPDNIEIPTFTEAAAYQSAAATGNVSALLELAEPSVRVDLISLDGGTNNALRVTPIKPLLPETKYLVAVAGSIYDMKGNKVYPSIAYDKLRNPESKVLSELTAMRPAIQGWERLASGYFSFKSAVYQAAGLSVDTPTAEDILFSLTFTTTATDAPLKSIAAPEFFFEKSLRTSYKQDAIEKLVGGTYNLAGDNNGVTTTTDGAINSTINFLLTSPQLPDTSPNPLYNSTIATAINAGATYASLSSDATAAHIMQRAAAEAAISVHDSGAAEAGDQAPYVSIAAEAAGTVQAMAAGVEAPPAALFPIPSPRATNFFRVDNASDINPGLIAPAKVYQGEITLPYYSQIPAEGDGSPLLDGSWVANQTIGAVIDAAKGNPGGTTPPSEMVTYRYPFPAKTTDVTVPMLVTMPDELTLSALEIPRPAAGWPVVIYVHGITTDRSISLPMANAMAFACVNSTLTGPSGAPCFATIAIDQPLHGVGATGSVVPGLTSYSHPTASIEANLPTLSPNTPSVSLAERHFNYTADESLRPTPFDYDAGVGSSGSLFVNLSHFVNVRDNLRQMTLDLLNLNASLATMDVDGNGLADDFDTSKVYFLGHSLGGVDGLPFVVINNDPVVQNSPFSNQPKVQAASAMFSGGGIPRLLTNSRQFSPSISQGLAAASDALSYGNSGLETYLNVYQGVLDSIDPSSLIANLADENADTGVLLFEIVGDGTASHPNDGVIPNGADTIHGEANGPLQTTLSNGFVIDNFPAPFAGTEPLVKQLGAVKTADATDDGDPAVLVTRLVEGSHATPVVAGNTDIDPFTSGAAFNEMIAQIVTFFALDGNVTGSIVANPEVVED